MSILRDTEAMETGDIRCCFYAMKDELCERHGLRGANLYDHDSAMLELWVATIDYHHAGKKFPPPDESFTGTIFEFLDQAIGNLLIERDIARHRR